MVAMRRAGRTSRSRGFALKGRDAGKQAVAFSIPGLLNALNTGSLSHPPDDLMPVIDPPEVAPRDEAAPAQGTGQA